MVGTQSPWGRIDWAKEIAPGIWCVTTPSHGGYWLSSARVAEMPAELSGVRTFVERSGRAEAGGGTGRWYEEDCDAALVALAFPQYFPREFVSGAARIIGARSSPVVAVWLDRLPANDIRRGGAEPARASGPFELTGSDRPADAPGQGNLL